MASRFEAPNLEEEQIRKHFRIPKPGEAYEVYSVADVLGVINLELKTQLSATKVGMLLNKLGFKKVRERSEGFRVHPRGCHRDSSLRSVLNDISSYFCRGCRPCHPFS